MSAGASRARPHSNCSEWATGICTISRETIHVKQSSLFPDAEPTENLVEHVFDVDPPRDPAHRVSGAPNVLGTEFDGLRIAR